jgi:hypothetical protein
MNVELRRICAAVLWWSSGRFCYSEYFLGNVNFTYLILVATLFGLHHGKFKGVTVYCCELLMRNRREIRRRWKGG